MQHIPWNVGDPSRGMFGNRYERPPALHTPVLSIAPNGNYLTVHEEHANLWADLQGVHPHDQEAFGFYLWTSLPRHERHMIRQKFLAWMGWNLAHAEHKMPDRRR